jgi:hypothetical protein
VNHEGQEIVCPSVTTILNVINKPFLVPWAAKISAESTADYIRQHLRGIKETGQRISWDNLVEDAIQHGKGAHRRIVTVACEVGTITHDLIEARILSDDSITDEAIREAVEGYLTSLQNHLDYLQVPDIEGVCQKVRDCTDQFEAWWRGMGLACVEAEKAVYSPTHRYAGTMDCLATNGDGFVLCDWKTSNYYSEEYALQTVAYKKAYEELHSHKIGDIYIVRIGKLDAELEVILIPESDHEMLFEAFLAVRKLHDWKATYKHKRAT